MTRLTINLPPHPYQAEWLDRVNGSVCVNGSTLVKCGRSEAMLFFGKRTTLTADEAATFVRNFVTEGFDDRLTLG